MIKEYYRLAISSILVIILTILNIFPFSKFGDLIDRISKNTISRDEIIKVIIMMFLTILLVYIVDVVKSYIIYVAYDRILNEKQEELFRKLLKQTPYFFSNHTMGEVYGRLNEDIQMYIARFYEWGFYTFLEGVVKTLVIISYIFYTINLKFAILINIPYIIVTLFIIKFNDKYIGIYNQMNSKYDEISSDILESIKSIRLIKSYNLSEKITKIYKEKLRIFSMFSIKYKMRNVYSHMLNILAVAFSYFILIIYGYYLYSLKLVSFGNLISVSLVMALLPWPYTMLSTFIISVSELKNANKRVDDLLKEKDILSEEKENLSLDFKDSIEFKNFNFYFDDKHVLKDISFKINKGETIGIVGKTGSGKTTLIKQLLRLYESSDIYIDGNEIKKYDLKSLRSNFGYASQEYFIFSKTIKENILFYRNLEDKLDNVLYIADLNKDIEGFKDKLDTLVGENGVALSGGQKQRINIARAILSNPNILIFDDSLSALDVKTERNIITRLYDYRKNMTNIIISHRISSIKNADKIIVLNDGKIENIGTHEQLLESSVWYKDLYIYQNEREK